MMRELISLIEAAEKPSVSLRNNIINLVKSTEDSRILNRVLTVLQAGNLDERIINVVKSDEDAKLFLKQIVDAFIQNDASTEEKEEFLKKFPSGILNIKKLLDGKSHTIEDLVGAGFPTSLFRDLSVRLVSQGVGAGEIALSIMSPKIKWSGRAEGGGDILVNGRPIEVKTRVSSGGRWINARKAKMDLQKIKDTIEDATGVAVPDRLNIDSWVNVYRPAIQGDKKKLDTVTKTIANSLFKATNNSAYQKALKSGSAEDIKDEHLRTGYNNYKALSNFEGILIIDLPTDTMQYFKDYDGMVGKIKTDTIYIYAPENEIMPKVILTTGYGGRKGAASSKTAPDTATTSPSLSKAAAAITGGRAAKPKPKNAIGDVGRQKRKK